MRTEWSQLAVKALKCEGGFDIPSLANERSSAATRNTGFEPPLSTQAGSKDRADAAARRLCYDGVLIQMQPANFMFIPYLPRHSHEARIGIGFSFSSKFM